MAAKKRKPPTDHETAPSHYDLLQNCDSENVIQCQTFLGPRQARSKKLVCEASYR